MDCYWLLLIVLIAINRSETIDWQRRVVSNGGHCEVQRLFPGGPFPRPVIATSYCLHTLLYLWSISFICGCWFTTTSLVWQAEHDKSGLSWESPIESQWSMCEIEKALFEIGKSLREITKSLYEKLKIAIREWKNVMRDHNYQSRMKNCHVRSILTVDNWKIVVWEKEITIRDYRLVFSEPARHIQSAESILAGFSLILRSV